MAKYARGKGYFDWDEFFQSGTPDDVYRRLAGFSDDIEAEDSAFYIARTKARDRVIPVIVEEYGCAGAKQITGCDKGLISNMTSGEKTFCFPSKSWERLAYKIMHTSIHDLLLGVKKPVVLPKGYSVLATEAQKLPESDLKRLSLIGKKMVDEYYQETEDDFGHHRPMATLLRERVKEILDETGEFHYRFLDTEFGKTPLAVKGGLSKFWSVPTREWKTPMLMYGALCLAQGNLDYLTAEDPLGGYNDAVAVLDGQEPIPVTGYVKDIIRSLLILEPERKEKFAAMIASSIYVSILA